MLHRVVAVVVVVPGPIELLAIDDSGRASEVVALVLDAADDATTDLLFAGVHLRPC